MVVALLAMFPLLPDSRGQSTAPATRPSSLDPRAAELARGLSADDFATRQRAEDALVELGPSVAPTLELLLERSTDDEVRARLQSALTRIDELRRFGPTRITLQLKDASAKEAFTALWSQLGRPLPVQSNAVFAGVTDKVSIDCVNEPFWSVMIKLTEQTGIGVQGTGDGAQLVMHGTRTPPPHQVSGAFLVRAETAQRTYVVHYANGNASSSDFNLQFTIAPEPKLEVANSPSPRSIKITRAQDELGRNMVDGQSASAGIWRNGALLNYTIRLRSPNSDAKKLAVLSGVAMVPVHFRFETARHDRLNEAASQRVGDMRISFEPIKKVGDRNYALKVTLHRDGASDDTWAVANHQSFASVRLEDAAGQPLDRREWGSSGSNGQRIEATINFVRTPRGDKDTGEPVRLIWRIPVESKELEVPFEFRDLPLPG